MPSTPEVNHPPLSSGAGDETALEQLFPLVYEELRRIAHRRMRDEQAGHTLQTTALVNEAYLKLAGQQPRWENRAHFFAIAARVMREILIDYARAKRRGKRGGGIHPLAFDELDEGAVMSPELLPELIGLDEALNRLAALDPRQGQIVELRYFGGLTVEETAEVLGTSPSTVAVEWRLARGWLKSELIGNRPYEP
ncbi:MAG: sigma-70 family RNA polymerase sigma factor [Pyrinomonadaceae bacterium]